MQHKECRVCERTLPLSKFGFYDPERDQYYHTCSECKRKQRLPWNLKPQEWRWGYVYLLKADGIDRYKVGRTISDPKERAAKINSESPIAVKLVAALESPGANMLEWELHNECKDYHHHNEWYDLPYELVERIMRAMRVANEMKPESDF